MTFTDPAASPGQTPRIKRHMTCAAVALCATVLTQATWTVTGRVVDGTGLPLPGVLIAVKGSTPVAVTNNDGSFAAPQVPPAATLVFSLPGFLPREVQMGRQAPVAPLTITLAIAGVSEAVTVSGQLTPPASAALAMTPLDVVRTPGTQADLMQALGTLPGVARIDDGTGLFVRGGDVSETLVLLDGVVVSHPYRYETPTGGFRGAIDPFLTQGVSFTTGGFSAQYANTLSGVVDLVTLGRPREPQTTLTAGLAGISASAAWPLGEAGGVRIGANRSTPAVLFAVNPSPREFDRLPGGWDLSGSAFMESPRAGNLRVFGLAQSDHVGVEMEKDAFVGFLHSGTRHGLVALRWERGIGSWRASASGGHDLYRKSTDVGVLAVDEDESHASVRAEALGGLRSWTVRMNLDADRRLTRVDGRVPSKGGDFGGISGVAGFTVDRSDWRTGTAAIVSRRAGPFTPELGLRIDRFDGADAWTVAPRAAIRWQMSDSRTLRFAWGRYHQAPAPGYFDLERGAVELDPMEATHYVIGYERGDPGRPLFFRAEGYWKRYRSLPLEDAIAGFTSAGYGTARGIDLFARRIWPRVDLRLSGSALYARRRWTAPEQRERYPLPEGAWTPDFAIPYSWTVVANVPIVRALAIAGTWRVAAGRPFTPVAGIVSTPAGVRPVWASINSDQLPRYERLDLGASVIKPFGARTTAVFFASVDNMLARRNFFEYAYSPDYSVRRPLLSAVPRSFYIGCSISR
jgi:vitamin B12 transporter